MLLRLGLGGVNLLLKGAEAAREGRGAAGAVGRGGTFLLLGVGLEVAVGVGNLLAGVAGDGEGRGGEVGARHGDGWGLWWWDRGLFVCFGWTAWKLGLAVQMIACVANVGRCDGLRPRSQQQRPEPCYLYTSFKAHQGCQCAHSPNQRRTASPRGRHQGEARFAILSNNGLRQPPDPDSTNGQ